MAEDVVRAPLSSPDMAKCFDEPGEVPKTHVAGALSRLLQNLPSFASHRQYGTAYGTNEQDAGSRWKRPRIHRSNAFCVSGRGLDPERRRRGHRRAFRSCLHPSDETTLVTFLLARAPSSPTSVAEIDARSLQSVRKGLAHETYGGHETCGAGQEVPMTPARPDR